MAQTKRALEPKEQIVPVSTEIEESIFEQFKDTVQSIGHRAFELFEKRGRRLGSDLEDWLRAESEFIRPVPLEIRETENALEIRAEVPGFKPGELKLFVEPRRLTISGETEMKTEQKEASTLYSEWRSRKIFRAFELPVEIEATGAKATLSDGILNFTLPKAKESEPRKIEIETAK